MIATGGADHLGREPYPFAGPRAARNSGAPQAVMFAHAGQ